MAERNEGKPIASPDDTMGVALSLARAGWYVFPVKLVPVEKTDDNGKVTKTVDKRPLVRWLEGATNDPEQIATWWGSEFPGAWVGVNAQRSGIVVVDLDLAKNGSDDTGKANLKAAGIKLPKTLAYKTRSGGTHHIYRAPKGTQLTIAKDHPVPLVDIRAGNGLMVYYGPALDTKPDLADAPKWACVEAKATYNRSGGSVDTWLERASDGKPSADLKHLWRHTDWRDLKHEPMLAAVSDLIKRGADRGAATTYERARTAYVHGRPDRERDWDNAAEGSIGQHGLPPVTIELTKAQRQHIVQRNTPEAIEAATANRKGAARAKYHNDAMAALAAGEPMRPGTRVLEDKPLADEVAATLTDTWAYHRGLGLMRWGGQVWAPAEEHSLVHVVSRALADIEIAEHTVAASRGDNKAVDKARTLLSRGRAYAVARLVVGILAEREVRFDADADLLNTPTGILDLRTLKLRAHAPGAYMTKMTGAPFDKHADMTMWQRALESLPASVRPWLQERWGQAITGHVPDDDVLLIMQGGGNNAKTTTLDALREAAGDYAVTVSRKLLDADPGAHPTELMDLMGARIAVFEELSEGRNLNVTRLKDTVGTPKITAHRMRQDNVTFRAEHALMGSTNYLPVVSETDWGTWRRLALVVFPYRFIDKLERASDRLIDPSIKAALAQPDAGVLRWLAEGAARWYANGCQLGGRSTWPKPVRRATEAWRLEADPVLAYVTERLERDEHYAIPTADLARDFNEWLEGRGHHVWSQQTLNARFAGHTVMDGVPRKMVKFSGSVSPSRPPFNLKPVPANTTAWRGIRFVNDDRVPSEAERDAAELADLERRVK
jgi:putative DNA primase/helicase